MRVDEIIIEEGDLLRVSFDNGNKKQTVLAKVRGGKFIITKCLAEVRIEK